MLDINLDIVQAERIFVADRIFIDFMIELSRPFQSPPSKVVTTPNKDVRESDNN